jgi:hypothetical protein
MRSLIAFIYRVFTLGKEGIVSIIIGIVIMIIAGIVWNYWTNKDDY